MAERENRSFDFITTGSLARAQAVSPQTILNWVKAGWLQPTARDSAGRLLFRPEALASIAEHRRGRTKK